MVVRNFGTGQTWRYFKDDLLKMDHPPHPIGADTLVVAYYASAEMNCYLALGWELPENILDLFTEFRCLSNGLTLQSGGSGLLGALNWHGLKSMDAVEKTEMRELAMSGGPYTATQKIELLDYCESDVIALERLLLAMSPSIDLPHALLRGRYMKVAAHIEFNGIPIDTEALNRLKQQWENIQAQLILEIDQQYGVFEGNTFKAPSRIWHVPIPN
jgi:hypothetical protein